MYKGGRYYEELKNHNRADNTRHLTGSCFNMRIKSLCCMSSARSLIEQGCGKQTIKTSKSNVHIKTDKA